MSKVLVNLVQPDALPQAVDPAEYIVPPKWAVRLVSTNAGKRGKHYPESWTRGYQTYPYGAEDGVDVWGPMQRSNEDWRKEYNERKQREEDELTKHVMRGNLKEEQYRYWNGTVGMASNVATCRWCRQWCYGPEAMRKHQEQTDHNRILAAVYECARGHRLWHCFVCRAGTKHQHWGIPMCSGNKCRNKWRTAPIPELSTMLLMYAKLAFNKGLLHAWLNEDKSEKFNISTDPKKFNWERADAY